jgi:hypothetical protein
MDIPALYAPFLQKGGVTCLQRGLVSWLELLDIGLDIGIPYTSGKVAAHAMQPMQLCVLRN